MCSKILFVPLYAVFLYSGVYADNPRSHLMIDPVNPRLSPSGFMVTAGPAWSLVLRQGSEYLVGSQRKARTGLTSRLFGGGVEASYDNADPSGRWHLMPFASLAVFPEQKAYSDDVEKTLFTCNYYHFSSGLAVCLSDLPASGRMRRYAALGPALNLLVYQNGEVISRAAWGISGRAGVIRPVNGKFDLILEMNYHYAYFNRYYWGYDLDMYEHTHALGLSVGVTI